MNEQKFHLGIKALVMNSKNEILVLKANPAELKGAQKVHWDLPGGRIHEGDAIEDTLQREVEEELGMRDISIVSHFDSFISNIKIPIDDGHVGLILFVYLCKIKNTKQKFKLSFEHTEYKWASINESKKLLAYKYPKSLIKNLDKLKQHKV